MTQPIEMTSLPEVDALFICEILERYENAWVANGYNVKPDVVPDIDDFVATIPIALLPTALFELAALEWKYARIHQLPMQNVKCANTAALMFAVTDSRRFSDSLFQQLKGVVRMARQGDTQARALIRLGMKTQVKREHAATSQN